MSPQSAPLDWEECCCILKQLQAAAHSVHDEVGQLTAKSTIPEPATLEHSSSPSSAPGSNRQLRALLVDILSCLQEFRTAVNATFLLNGATPHETQPSVANNRSPWISRGYTKRVAELLAAVQEVTKCAVPSVEDIRTARADAIAEELTVVGQLNQVLASHGLPLVDSTNVQLLQILIQRLRQQEQQLEFHRSLLHAQREFAGANGKYSEENFAYGSTPFPTWLHLFTQPAIRCVIGKDPIRARLTVFGSSTGSLALFAALSLGIRCTGIELLPFLHETAEQMREELHVSSDRCRFVCADMLSASLESTTILLLTSQCWDVELYAQVQRKLELELHPGALVLDYKRALQRSPRFRLLQHVQQQRVSWSDSQSLFVFERLG